MKTEYRFAQALKVMMSEKPLEEISVLSLCRKCHVNRQTFYYHFHDIYDLLTLVFLNEKIENINDAKNFKEMIISTYEYYDKNRKFIDASISSAGKDLVQEFFFNNYYQTIYNILNKYETSSLVSVQNKKNVARFYASAFSYSTVYYLISYNKKTLDGLLSSFGFVDQIDLAKTLRELRKKSAK